MKECPTCGHIADAEDSLCAQCGHEFLNSNPLPKNGHRFPAKNILLYFVLTVISMGLFGIYWYLVTVNDLKKVYPEEDLPNAGKFFVFTIFSFGIYSLFYWYRIGKKVDEQYAARNMSTNRSVFYLLMSWFMLVFLLIMVQFDMQTLEAK